MEFSRLESKEKEIDILKARCEHYRNIINAFAEDEENTLADIIDENEDLKDRISKLLKTNGDLNTQLFCREQIDKLYEYYIETYGKEPTNRIDNDLTYCGCDNISWEEYYMGIAQFVRLRSKDPCTKVGACIVLNNRIISTGYNGFPNKLSDKEFPWTKGDEDDTKNKYYYVVHAERNAILSAKRDLEGATLYVTLFPCNECAKSIIQSGIKKVIYFSVYGDGGYSEEKEKKIAATQKMFEAAGITYYHYDGPKKTITIKV